MAVDCNQLDVVHGVIGQTSHGVPAGVGQVPGVGGHRPQVVETGAGVTDHDHLVPSLVRGSQLELK